jgi:hypothetical protein
MDYQAAIWATHNALEDNMTTDTKTVYRIMNAESGHCFGGYLAHSSAGAVRALLADAGETQLTCDHDVEDVDAAMRDYNRERAPGSECNAWQDYVADLAKLDSDDAQAITDFADYWLLVADGECADYDLETGESNCW